MFFSFLFLFSSWVQLFDQCVRSTDSIDESLNDVSSLSSNQPYIPASSDVAEIMGHGQPNMLSHSQPLHPPSTSSSASSLPPSTSVNNNNEGLMEMTMESMQQQQQHQHHLHHPQQQLQQQHQHKHHHHHQNNQHQQHQNLNSITMNIKPDWGLTAL